MRFKEKQFRALIQVWWKEYTVEGWAVDLQSNLESWKRKYRLGQKPLWVAKTILFDEIQGLNKKEESSQLSAIQEREGYKSGIKRWAPKKIERGRN